MRFVKIGSTRWVNVGVGHIVYIQADAGRSLVCLTTGSRVNDPRPPESLIADLEKVGADPVVYPSYIP